MTLNIQELESAKRKPNDEAEMSTAIVAKKQKTDLDLVPTSNSKQLSVIGFYVWNIP
jgi:hypothetical protein